MPLKGIRRAPLRAIQEPLAPLIAHWSERIIFINATLPGVELEIVMNEMRKLMKSADFFANISHDIYRFQKATVFEESMKSASAFERHMKCTSRSNSGATSASY